MGTYYLIQWRGQTPSKFAVRIDSILHEINMAVSTYIDSSLISQLNAAKATVYILPTHTPRARARSYHFIRNAQLADSIYRLSHGAFDPTVLPAVEYWGFGKRKSPPDSDTLPDTIRRCLGMRRIALHGDTVIKALPCVQLDFSAIAKGYAVDVLANWLQRKGVQHFLVDIGGEVRAHGFRKDDQPWIVGIQNPHLREFSTLPALRLQLFHRAVATSGNYRNFHLRRGKKIVHTIDPRTGYPIATDILSASIVHPTCAVADALATACMVMGSAQALSWIDSLPNTEACFIASTVKGDTILFTQGFPMLLLR